MPPLPLESIRVRCSGAREEVVAPLTRCLRITPRSHKASHHEFEFLDASVKVFILERDCTLAAVTNELCIIAKPSTVCWCPQWTQIIATAVSATGAFHTGGI